MAGHDHIIVIGAGIAGSSVCYYLNQAGMHVTLIDQDGAGDNCSYGNAGLIVPSHFTPLASPGVLSKGLRWMLKSESPFSLKPRLDSELFVWGWKFIQASSRSRADKASPVLKELLMKNRELLIDLDLKEAIEFGLQKKGLLILCNSKKGLEAEQEVVRRSHQLGLSAKMLSPSEVKEMEPDLQMNIAGAVFYPEDAHFHPGLLMNGLKNLLKERGVHVLYNTKVTGLESKGDRITGVKTEGGRFLHCSDVIFCMGADTSLLKKELGISMPMQAGKGYSITMEQPKVVPERCVILSEAYVAVTPMDGSLRFAGTMEMAGFDKSINQTKIKAMKNAISEYLPDYQLNDLDNQSIWVGLRPCSPDGLPYAGKLDPYKNAYVSCGHAMLGMSLGLACGKMISELITDGESEPGHALLRACRYHSSKKKETSLTS
jgi:D-amino-acid dehydrogenase